MAANSLAHVSEQHISIVKNCELDNFVFKKCLNEECPHKSCSGEGFHCPLCPEDSLCKEKPSKIKQHFSTVHVDKRVTDQGEINILRCKLNCQFSSQRVSKVFSSCQPHYHCYLCKNGFPREKEIVRHIKTAHHLEKTGLPDKSGSTKKTAVKESTDPPPKYDDAIPSTSQCTTSESQAEEIENMQDMAQESREPNVSHELNSNREEQMQDINIKENEKGTTEYLLVNFHSMFASKEEQEPKVRKSSQSKVPCPSCKKLFHPNSLSQHVRSQHFSSPAVNKSLQNTNSTSSPFDSDVEQQSASTCIMKTQGKEGLVVGEIQNLSGFSNVVDETAGIIQTLHDVSGLYVLPGTIEEVCQQALHLERPIIFMIGSPENASVANFLRCLSALAGQIQAEDFPLLVFAQKGSLTSQHILRKFSKKGEAKVIFLDYHLEIRKRQT